MASSFLCGCLGETQFTLWSSTGTTKPATPKIGGTNTTYLYSSEILIGAYYMRVRVWILKMIVPNPLIRDRAQNLELYNSLFNKPAGLLLLGEYPTIRVTGVN